MLRNYFLVAIRSLQRERLYALINVIGLAVALTVARRSKEISVRRILGASSQQIVTLLNSEFIWLTIIGNLIAWPSAYFATKAWLYGFAYHLSPSILPFLFAGCLTLAIVVLTVSIQAVRAAQANPVDSLRYE
jgi:ABC-type antimicrobial peptide transport system permease subunit